MLQYLIFISFFNCFFSDLNYSIVEGTFHIYYPPEDYVQIMFKAIENGTFLFLFSNNATIREVSGKLSEDLDINPDYYGHYFKTKVYAQNFTVGDYFKGSIRAGMDEYITIKKVDANFRFMHHEYEIFWSYYYDCEKPLYFFTINDKTVHNKNQYYVHVQNHFGEVKSFYKKECFITNLNLTDDNSFDRIKNDSLAKLPICDVNIIKFECEQPSLFTFYAAKKNFYIYSEIQHVNLVYNKISIDSYASLYKINRFFFQSFHLVGNTTYDFTKFGKGVYSAQDFYFNYSYPERFRTAYTVSNGTSEPSLVIDFLNNGFSKEKLTEENVKTLCEDSILIKLKPEKNKKYIKIENTVNPFRVCYIFSMTEDLNYLPQVCGFFSLVHENYTYINNPYHYNNKNNNYTWFISLSTYGSRKDYITYKYTNQYSEDGKDEPEKDEKSTDKKEDSKEDEGKKGEDIKEDEKNSDGGMSLASKVFLGIGTVVIIGVILFLAYLFYRKSKSKNSEFSFNLIGNKPLKNSY